MRQNYFARKHESQTHFRLHRQNASPDVVKVLAANKCDATAHRAVDAERGQKIAENFDMPFFEVSCKENINIEEAFLTLARRIREQRGRRVRPVRVESSLVILCFYCSHIEKVFSVVFPRDSEASPYCECSN